jgi:hypothetical protein
MNIEMNSDLQTEQQHRNIFTSPELRRVAMRRYLAERSIALAHSTRKAYRAEERLAAKRKRETELFQQAIRLESDDTGEHKLYHKAQRTLAVAQAVCETEMKVATRRRKIAELKLQATADAVDAVDAQLSQAEGQISAILDHMASQGFVSDSPKDFQFSEPWTPICV